MQLKSDISLQR